MITRHVRKASDGKRAKRLHINKGPRLFRDKSRSRGKMYKIASYLEDTAPTNHILQKEQHTTQIIISFFKIF